ncbi:hypothetical protein KSF78_0008684 [Schistosoma japonicum]|nr:hypothetical protein KSF78_0008684 [Schistosoma japonicum]
MLSIESHLRFTVVGIRGPKDFRGYSSRQQGKNGPKRNHIHNNSLFGGTQGKKLTQLLLHETPVRVWNRLTYSTENIPVNTIVELLCRHSSVGKQFNGFQVSSRIIVNTEN